MKSTKKAYFTVIYRSLKNLNVNSLIKDLNEVPWTVLDTFDDDPDEMLSTWEALVLDVVDQHAPLNSVRVISMKKPSWLSNEILTAIKECDRLKKELEKGRIQYITRRKVSFRSQVTVHWLEQFCELTRSQCQTKYKPFIHVRYTLTLNRKRTLRINKIHALYIHANP